MSDRDREVIEWLIDGDNGISSECLALTAIGLLRRLSWVDKEPPADPADLGRCLRLLHRHPWIREVAFPRLRRLPQWRRLIKNWDKLAGMMEKEVGRDWSKGDSAPKTYTAMKAIGL